MKKIIILAAVAATLAACNNDMEMATDSREADVICMSAGIEATATTTTRAASLPTGSSQIAVVACYTDPALYPTPNDAATKWDAPYVDHQKADVISVSSKTYNFSWTEDNKQYWPEQGEEIQLIAYSPIAMDGSCVTTPRGSKIDVSLPDRPEDMPDVIVANKTPKRGDVTGRKTYGKDANGKPIKIQNPEKVQFDFTHVLSRLSVYLNAQGGNPANPTIVSRIQVIIDKSAQKKTLDMADKTWTAGEAAANDIVYTYDNDGKGWTLSAQSKNASKTLLFPDTQSSVKVRIFINDTEGVLSEVQLDDILPGNFDKLHFSKGNTTGLYVTIKENKEVSLRGSVTAWENTGDYSVSIHPDDLK